LHQVAAVNAIAFFFFWLLVLLAGADKPPPPRFLWLIPLLLLCAAAVYWRVPAYINWSQTRPPGRFLRVALEGLAAGLIVALVAAAVAAAASRNAPSGRDFAIWLAVLGLMGVLNSVTLYGLNSIPAWRNHA
jgi:4-amino-4-deoxy-L-arabinose transferase-like glycosyltransferase